MRNQEISQERKEGPSKMNTCVFIYSTNTYCIKDFYRVFGQFWGHSSALYTEVYLSKVKQGRTFFSLSCVDLCLIHRKRVCLKDILMVGWEPCCRIPVTEFDPDFRSISVPTHNRDSSSQQGLWDLQELHPLSRGAGTRGEMYQFRLFSQTPQVV